MYKKILFCTDLYPASDYAFASALDMAQESDAELIVLHVLESRHRYSGQLITDDGEVWGSTEVFDKLKKKLKEYYFTRVDEAQQDAIQFTVRGGIPWLEILRVARLKAIDLIVMGPCTVRGSVLEFMSKQPRLGSNAASGVPGGIYPCKGGGQNDYCYIFVQREMTRHWERFCKAIGHEELIDDPRFSDGNKRNENRAALEAIVSAWTRERTKEEVMKTIGSEVFPPARCSTSWS